MKRVFAIIIFTFIAIAAITALLTYRVKPRPVAESSSTPSSHAVNISTQHPTPPGPVQNPNALAEADWHRLNSVRDATLKANPDLTAEYQAIFHEMQTQEAKFDKAMVEADPKVAPLVAKFVALRESMMRQGPPPANGGK